MSDIFALDRLEIPFSASIPPFVDTLNYSSNSTTFLSGLLIHMQNETRERDNEDNCAACGGTGALLCCDSCVRSFHFTCLEPPQDAENAPEGKWYCRACIAQKNDRAARLGNEFEEDPRENVPDVDGVFRPLFSKLHGKTERSYALPKVVAEAFEGVKAGEHGEYEEMALPRNRLASSLEFGISGLTN